MKFVVDESADAEIVHLLRSEKHEVIYVAESAPSVADIDVLSLAHNQNAILITADKDFGELVFRKKRPSSGVILIRIPPYVPGAGSSSLRELVDQKGQLLNKTFVVLKEDTIRIRPLPE